MSARNTVRRNKTAIQTTLCGDHRLILTKVHENNLITGREYNNLKSIAKENVEGHVVELVDKIMDKGEDSCRAFLNLLQTDEDIKMTFPDLGNVRWNETGPLRRPVQPCSADDGGGKRRKEDTQYELSSQPAGLCLIINNENFNSSKPRSGTQKDARSLAQVFSWLDFRVLMAEDQTKDRMDLTLKCFSAQNDVAQLQQLGVREWSGGAFVALTEAPRHGDAFICCILSHGEKGVIYGTDWQPLSIKHITRTFKAELALAGKPKVFLIQACQGGRLQRGVLSDLQTDGCPSPFIPEDADVLLAVATVEDHLSFRHKEDGSWFIQSVCRQLADGCPRGEDVTSILHRVNDEVSQKEGGASPGAAKQMPEVRFTLRKKLVLSPKDA